MILTLPDTTRIDTAMVDRMLTELRRGCPPQREKAIVRQVATIGTRLNALRLDLAGPDGASGKLGAGWDYLARQDDDQRFAVWVGWLNAYAACCNAQAAIRDGLAQTATRYRIANTVSVAASGGGPS